VAGQAAATSWGGFEQRLWQTMLKLPRDLHGPVPDVGDVADGAQARERRARTVSPGLRFTDKQDDPCAYRDVVDVDRHRAIAPLTSAAAPQRDPKRQRFARQPGEKRVRVS
jgi:hypothetical protein